MVSDSTYELCLPVLEDTSLEDEERTDKLEELLRKETTLVGNPLENAILDILWRHRDGKTNSSPLIRHNVLRRASPAPWQIPRVNSYHTPISSSPRLGVSPLAPPGFLPHTFNRTVSSTASPFTSPRPSPRLNFSTPAIPHSPSLNAYEFPTDTAPSQDNYGDYGSDNVDWLVNDDAVSVTSSAGGQSSFNAAAGEFVPAQIQQSDMSLYDMLRSILGPAKSDDEIEAALALHGYDLSATIVALMEGQEVEITVQAQPVENNVVIGKTMDMQRPVTPLGQQKSGVVCRFWLSTGQCLRADCRFSHDLSNHICKYWVMGNCLAGDTCIFSHDPSHFMNRLALDGSETPPLTTVQPNIQYQDYSSFPTLQGSPEQQWNNKYQTASAFQNYPQMAFTPPPGLKNSMQGYNSDNSNSRSRPTSRNCQMEQAAPTPPTLDDTEAFPSLGATLKPAKKHHGKRGGHSHNAHKDGTAPLQPSSLADVVKMSPSPGPLPIRKLARNASSASMTTGENSAAAQAIPSPQHVPWLETGERANKAYLKARQDAIKHGGLRNKFLQSAAQAWNRNDARAAKALSLRGQSENDLMRRAHREAAALLYDSRNSHGPSMNPQGHNNLPEIYVDLHGLHPEEAVEYLERVLLEHSRSERPVYAITGTGHHSKNGKDKVGKAIRGFLNEWRYAFREFSVPGDRNNVGGILGIDARSCVKEKITIGGAGEKVDLLEQGHEIGDGKIRMLVRDQTKGRS